MRPVFLGIDTSNYTTSAALYDGVEIWQDKQLLPVKKGELGLRQSDAVFAHTKQLPLLLERLMGNSHGPVQAVGVSVSPRDEKGSYMPCFLAGESAARSAAAALGVPCHRFSHQAGHIAAALYGADKLELLGKPFLAFHVSGGTTQCLHVAPGADSPFLIRTVAQSLDLHAGQAVDRAGALLGLDFPAGPALEELALACGTAYRPRPSMKGLDCCLSGLENQCRERLDRGESREEVARYCIDFLTQTILAITGKALEREGDLPLVYAGGVMSNKIIRQAVEERFGGFFAPPSYSADNAAGIALLCALRHDGEIGEDAVCRLP